MKQIHLFDFDGTLTFKDSLFEIARFSTSPFTYWIKITLLLPVFVVAKASLLSKQKAKELFLQMFFGGMNLEAFDQLCADFCAERIPQIIRPLGLDKLQTLREANEPVYIVSASPQNWIQPWASQYGIIVLGTQLETKINRITGRIAGNNCNGTEKVNRIKSNIDLSEFDSVEAYGDTSGDLPMLELATIKHFKPFR